MTVNKKTYYELWEEYRKLISQKQYNAYFYNRGRLEEVKAQLAGTVKRFRVLTISILVDYEKNSSRNGVYPCGGRYERLKKKADRLARLSEKLSNEEVVELHDCEDTYCGPIRPLIIALIIVWVVLVVGAVSLSFFL